MKSLNLLIVLLLLQINFTFSQDVASLFDVKLSGFVRTDFMLDTRQVVSAREGQFLLFPMQKKLDPDGTDINGRANFNYLAIISRANIAVSGPDLWSAKTTGVLEGDFFGNVNEAISSFRLRHAFIKLSWDRLEILTGRYWHPMFGVEYYPKTVSFNTGVPFTWLSRNGQIRITADLGKITLVGAVVTQRDFASPGGPDALRNSLLPDLQGQLKYYPSENTLLGLSLGYKQLLPRVETDSGYATTSMVRGFTSNMFFKYSNDRYTLSLYQSLLQNGFDGLAIGGYAINTITDSVRNIYDYTALNSANFWGEVYTNSKPFELGIFAGYAHNLGALEDIEDLSTINRFSRGANISYLYRVSPRVVYRNDNFKLGGEIEYTSAAYGNNYSEKGIPQNPDLVSNFRFIVTVTYSY